MGAIRYEEAIKITRGILQIFEKDASYNVTILLRRCARISELLNLDDILWINNELKGYPDDDVPPYRKIIVKCQYGWMGALPDEILFLRHAKEQFYKKWNEQIIIRESSTTLEKWAQEGHSFELRHSKILGINVNEIANVNREQYSEILHHISNKIREFASDVDIKYSDKVQQIKSDKKVITFLSASFSDEIDDIIKWFIRIMNILDFEVIWLKEKHQARPVEEKIKENLKQCNCFIQIITKQVYVEGKEAGWLGNEIAWARDSTPNSNIAVFVEKGIKATGIARFVTDNVEFDYENIGQYAPDILQFLNDVKSRVLGQK